MLTPFDIDQWQPTSPTAPNEVQLSKADLTSLSQKLSTQTREIARYPYDPCAWLHRSTTLSELLYPELALGDAYKAELLCRTHLAGLRERQGWKLGYRMGFWMLGDGHGDDEEDFERVQKYLGALQGRAAERLYGCTPADPEGGILHFRRRPYPWMLTRWRKRSDDLLDRINADFLERSVGLPEGEAWCVVQRHAFGKYSTPKDSNEVLGVFAARDIERDQILLTDVPQAWGCNGPGEDKDVVPSKTVEGCSDLSHAYTSGPHDSKVDLRWVRDQYGQGAASTIRDCRLLLCCINDEIDHPLDHPAISRLTAAYPRDRLSKFSLELNMVAPNEALQRFGIGIFANANYDTWVLFTIAARVATNACGDPIAEMIAPLYCLFNHSCEPNLDWNLVANHSGVRVMAKRDIKQGEQLCIIYDEYYSAADVDERRGAMWKWLDGPCQCPRCVREEADPRVSTMPWWQIPDEPVMTGDGEVRW